MYIFFINLSIHICIILLDTQYLSKTIRLYAPHVHRACMIGTKSSSFQCINFALYLNLYFLFKPK